MIEIISQRKGDVNSNEQDQYVGKDDSASVGVRTEENGKVSALPYAAQLYKKYIKMLLLYIVKR